MQEKASHVSCDCLVAIGKIGHGHGSHAAIGQKCRMQQSRCGTMLSSRAPSQPPLSNHSQLCHLCMNLLGLPSTYPHGAEVESIAKSKFKLVLEVRTLLVRPACPQLSLCKLLNVDCWPRSQLGVSHHLGRHDIPFVPPMWQWSTCSRISERFDMSAGHITLKISLLDDFQLINPSLPAGCTINVFWIILQVVAC